MALQDEEEDEAEAKYDELSTYKQCLKLMKEGETGLVTESFFSVHFL